MGMSSLDRIPQDLKQFRFRTLGVNSLRHPWEVEVSMSCVKNVLLVAVSRKVLLVIVTPPVRTPGRTERIESLLPGTDKFLDTDPAVRRKIGCQPWRRPAETNDQIPLEKPLSPKDRIKAGSMNLMEYEQCICYR